jgi:8-oxo-dGTP pyrophosphatase MutT (NUDIX family)
VGGGADQGETLAEAAVRETAEETGLRIGAPGPPVFTRRVQWVFEGVPYDQEETYFLVRVPEVTPSDDGWTDVEKATIVGHRWWTVDELRRTTDVVVPEGLADLLDRLL